MWREDTNMQREIGSNFWLNPNVDYKDKAKVDIAKFGITGTDFVLLSTGRSAESCVLEAIEKRNPDIRKVAMLPPFTCETVIEPFVKHNYEIHSYSIDRKLNMSPEMLKDSLIQTNAQVVLLHRYFGFDTLEECDAVIREFSQKGVIFIEDRTQCIFSDFEDLSVDYVIGSFRKWAGMPDGSFAVCKIGLFHNKPEQYDERLEKEKLIACYLKYGYMENGWENKPEFLYQYQKAEHVLDEQNIIYKISPVSESVLEKLDLGQLKRRRRANYEYIFNGLKDCDFLEILTPSLDAQSTPLYFAVILKNRVKLQEVLREENIFAPIVWPKADITPSICESAQEIYDRILCIPIDQRYNLEDMQRILVTIEKAKEFWK